MLFHVLYHAVNIFKISCVAELVYFIVTDGLDLHLLADCLKVFSGCSDGGNSGTRETDLGSRRELIYHIRMSFLLTFHKDFNEIILFVFI